MTELIDFSFYGETKNVWLSPQILTRSLLAQKILLSIRKKKKSSFEISTDVGASEDYVVDEIFWMSKNALVKKIYRDQWISNFIVLDKGEKKPFVDLAKQLSLEEASKIKEGLPRLKAAFMKCSFEGQGFSWNHMKYIILAALVTDLGVNYTLHKKGWVPPPPQRPDGGRWYFWGLEGGSDSKRDFGVNSNLTKDGGTAHIWSWHIKKPTTSPFNEDEVSLMSALAEESLTISEIAKAVNLDPETVKQKMKKLYKYGYFKKLKGSFKPSFPIFSRKDIENMIPEIIEISNSIVKDVINPNKAVFQRLFKETGLAKLRREYGMYLCMLYHIIMDHVLDRLVEKNILSEMPKEAKATWGFWGWRGELEILKI